jgi:hypothetical protein
MRSPARPAAEAISASACAAVSALLLPAVPKRIEAETSRAKRRVWFRSSRNRLTKGSALRAVAFQSMVRTSSPGT